jgi:orotate phosphoribosyltransferase
MGTGYYTWQFYLRQALFNPVVLNLITQDFLSKYEAPIKAGHFQLCGVESSSTPMLTAIAIACRVRGYDVDVFSIRKTQKGYGRRNWIEGKVAKNKVAMLIDDIVSSTHKTAIHGASILYNEGIPMASHAYALVYKTSTPQNDRIKLLGKNVTVGFMFNLNDFNLSLKSYQQRKWITLGPA